MQNKTSFQQPSPNADGLYGANAALLSDDPGVIALGLVVHRCGSSVVSGSDAMWMRALHALDEMTGVDPVGVIVRTKEGHLVKVHQDAAERAS
jgi:hypothetical protein